MINLNANSHISDSLFNKLYSNIFGKKLPNFKIYMKLHKSKFDTRPLINYKLSILSVISKFIDFYCKKRVNTHFTTIKDSMNLLQKTKGRQVDKNDKIGTSDFNSLYTNIPLEEAITIVSDEMSKEKNSDFDAFGFHTLLSLVLKNNYFFIKIQKSKHFYLQIKGVAMGTACGPSIANMYLAYYEIRYLHHLNVSLYFRFIDDNLHISKDHLTNSDFEKVYPNLKLDISNKEEVQFLDLSIKFDILKELNFDLYIKPTNTFSYLLTDLNHPQFIFKNIIKSLLHRTKRTCTELNRYYYHSSIISKNLLNRKYKFNLISNLIRYFSSIKRDSLLPYKEKNNEISNNILFISTFDRFLPNHSNFLNDIWQNSLDDNSILKKFQFKTIYRNHPNLNSYLINKIACPFSSHRYYICQSETCMICKFAITDYFLKNKKGLKILIPSKSSCNSSNCIYFITCLKCNIYYVGETSRNLSKRMTEHLNKIKYGIRRSNDKSKLENFLSKCNDSYILYKHFIFNHNINLDFKFQVFVKDFIFYRNRLETDLMIIFDTIYPNGLNTMNSYNLKSIENYSAPPYK